MENNIGPHQGEEEEQQDIEEQQEQIQQMLGTDEAAEMAAEITREDQQMRGC